MYKGLHWFSLDMDVCGHTSPCLRGACNNLGPNVYECHCPTNYFGPMCEHYYEGNYQALSWLRSVLLQLPIQ